ncbi:MAG: hypothetical protein ACTHKC_08385 [Candidatus Nitrosocosmicus sp.]
MEHDFPSKKSVNVTFRISKDIMDKLNEEADINYSSLNSLLNQILKRYVEWNRFDDKSSMIPITSSVLKELLDGLDKDQVIRLAKDKAKHSIYNVVLFMNGKVDFDTLISWYLQRMKYCSEIASKRGDNKSIRKIIFKHDLGENWSLYHKTILESICHDILSVPIKILTTDSTFMIEYDEENTIYAK